MVPRRAAFRGRPAAVPRPRLSVAAVFASCAILASGCASLPGRSGEEAARLRGPSQDAAGSRDVARLRSAAHALGCAILDSGRPGPSVLIIGGTHGDESSGTAAARLLSMGPPPATGLLALLPEANPPAVAAGERTGRDGVDLNRSYDATAAGKAAAGANTEQATERRAAAILDLACDFDLVIDLHEEGAAWPESDGPSFVLSPAAASLAMDIVEALEDEGRPFAFTGGAPRGSLVAELGVLGKPAFTVEVPQRLPEGDRVGLQVFFVKTALRVFSGTNPK